MHTGKQWCMPWLLQTSECQGNKFEQQLGLQMINAFKHAEEMELVQVAQEYQQEYKVFKGACRHMKCIVVLCVS
jgi:hypothetical protein